MTIYKLEVNTNGLIALNVLYFILVQSFYLVKHSQLIIFRIEEGGDVGRLGHILRKYGG